MGTKIRLTALLLAASLTMNMVIMPVKAEDIAAPTEQLETDPVESTSAETEPAESTTAETEPAESTTAETEPAESTTAETEPVESTTAETEPAESGAVEESSDLLEQPELLLEDETLLLEGSESPMLFALPRASAVISAQLVALAAGDTTSLNESNTITISSGDELYFLANSVAAATYQNCELSFVNNRNGFDVSEYKDFKGLGSDKAPFNGKIVFVTGSGSTVFKLKQPLFQYLRDSAQLDPLILHYAGEGSDQKTVLFAANVVGGNGSGNWNITLQGDPEDDVTCTPTLIGTIEAGSRVSLALVDLINLSVEADGNAGLLCGTLHGSLKLTSLSKSAPISVKATENAGGLVGQMGSGAELTVTLEAVAGADGTSTPASLNIGDVTATGGNAGGLVGKMAAGASLTINTDVEISGSVTTNGGDAGGLVGLAEYSAEEGPKTVTIKAVTNEENSTVSNLTLSTTSTISGTGNVGSLIGTATDIIFDGDLPTITGTGSISGANAGGLIGSYTYTDTVTDTVYGALSSVSQSISGITVNGSSNAGGVFGVLTNNSTFTINPTNPDVGTDAVSVTFGSGSTGNVGGLIGKYQAGDLKNAALILSAEAVASNLTSAAATYGGLIGLVDGNASYIEIGTTQTTTTSGVSATDFGGLIAKLSDSGHMVKTAGKVTVINSLPGSSTCGGLVGYMPSGVLWLGSLGIDLSITINNSGTVYQKRGWILGERNNTLVVTEQENWNYAKGSKTNDIGNWGQVLSVPSICANLADLLTVADHKVTVVAPAPYELGTKLDFAKVALGLQLESKGALEVTHISDNLTITLTDNINLNGTGLTGFQRDYDIGNAALNVNLNGAKGDGGSYSITLPDITVYIRDSSHNRQGLITKATDLVVDNLTITTPDYQVESQTVKGSFKAVAQDGSNYCIGGLAAEVTGNITLNNVTGSANLTSTNSGDESAVGGLIAVDTSDSATMKFTNCTWNGEITADSNKSGLYMGGFLGRALKQKAHKVQVNGGTISGELTRKGSTTEARMGAMIGSLIGESIENPLKLTIDGLTVSANVTSKATQHSGALLSYEWYRTNAIVKNVNVTNSSLTASSPFGGLVYKGSGYWSIQPTTPGEGGSGTITPGITISNSNFKGSPTGSSGLLVCHTEASVDFDALYLEILYGGYKIGGNVEVTGVSTFDEIAGCTKGEKGNGIVSIATENHDLIDKDTQNTYVNQLTNYSFTNSNTRYYYNLDSFGAARDSVPTGEINSPEKMVMYSAYSHAQTNIKKYFYTTPGNITGNIDLTGYSYYPAESFVNINNATVKFAFEKINDKETTNKPLDDSAQQHYGMHTGIFTGAFGQEADLKVEYLTLQGRVGGAGNNYGALIRDGASGQNANHMLTLNIGPVTLDGIRVIGNDEVKPLLINSLGSYTTLNMSGVTTSYDKNVKAASSLIGNVGSDTGAAINLTFSDMALDGKQQANDKTYNDPDSIFSRALFLESFRYSESNCSGVYNFGTDAERYTVGRELSNTGGGHVDGRNNGAQYWFHNSDTLICGADAEKDTYYKDYLRYVYNVEGKPDAKSHEIDVNVRTFGLTEGCGTYSHPYIITDGNQLKELAEVLNAKGVKEGWKVKLSEAVLKGTFSSQNGHTTSSAKDTDCVTYTGGKTDWRGTKDGEPVTADNDVVLKYLRNAYYVIRGKESAEPGKNEITLSGTWAGLGGGDTSTAFSGVIVGESGVIVGENGVTVKITRSDLGQQFGGLIKYSQGSVVKNLTIEYAEKPMVTANGVPTGKANATFFGGVVGWCIGGDTIIDNVTVTYQNGEPTVSGTTNTHLTAVGGYVGMVGGAINDAEDNTREKYGGGVVFRNMTADSVLTGDKAGESSNYFYYNPYVGRVLDGYAMLEQPKEGTTYAAQLKNTDKNYTIPTISADTHLEISNNTVTVNNAQGLWLLSAIANSGAGAMTNTNCLAYNEGKPRTGTYEGVGGELNNTMAEYSDETLLGGVGGNRTTCYLSQYVSGSFSNLCSSGGVSIVLNSDCDMSDYGNGFRGIGSSYGFNSAANTDYRLIKLKGVDGTKESTDRYKITLRQNRREYLEEKDSWTSIGAGLIVQFRGCGSATQTVCKNLILSGSTGVSYYQSGNSIGKVTDGMDSTSTYAIDTSRIGRVSVGALIANPAIRNDAQLLVENVTVTEMTVNSGDLNIRGSRNAGGLIGTICYYQADGKAAASGAVTLQDCTCSNLTVSGRDNVGGFIGYAQASTVNIRFSKNTELSNVNVNSTTSTKTKWNVYGFGGLIGFNDKAALTIAPIDGNQAARLMINGLTIQGNTAGEAETGAAGGIVGLWNTGTNTATVKNVSLEGIVNIAGSNNNTSKCMAGGLAGAFADEIKDNTWTSANNGSVTIESVWFAQNKNSVMQVYNGRPIGGLVGYLRLKATPTASVGFKDIRMGSDDGTVRIANNSNSDQWHAAGGLIGSNAGISNNAKITYQDIQMINTTVLVHRFNNNDFRGGGVLFAFFENTETIDLQNVTLDSCRVIANNKDTRVGLLYSWLSKDETLCGTNILIKDCVVGYSTADTCRTTDGSCPAAPDSVSYDGTQMGILGGDSNSKTVKLVGVSIQQSANTPPMKDFGTDPGTGSYVVRADYKGYQDGDDTKVAGAKAPYVTTSPLSGLGTLDGKRITGDGASFVTGGTTPVGAQILEDLKDPATNPNLKHSAALAYGEKASDANAKKAYTYLLENSGKAFFGDFKQQGGNSEEDYNGANFPVLTLVTNSSTDTNALIYSWISLLTNRTINDTIVSATGSGISITATHWKWNTDTGWKADSADSTDLPLQFTSNVFTLKKGVYDSGQNRFTLLDVAFADPAGGSEPAYHLYIPVIVQKMLRFRFWASAQTGTTYIKSSYMTQNALAAASHGQQVTVLMGFEYNRTQEQWQEAVNNGDKLLFGFDKTIQLEGKSLPGGTHLTLVDCANQNKAYYAKGTSIKPVKGNAAKYELSFANFTDAIYEDGELTQDQLAEAKWKPVYLCDMLNLSATGNSGQYYKLPQGVDTSNATLRIPSANGYDYYQYKAAEDEAPSSDGPYSITVGWKESEAEPRLREQYYLTIQTPEKPSEGFEICNNLIICPSSLGSAGLLPTLRENIAAEHKYSLNGNENRVLIGDFFTQTVSITTDGSNPEMSTDNHIIHATLTSQIRFNSADSADTFEKYAKEQKLYQSFELRMQETKEAEKQAKRINLVPGTRITAQYFRNNKPVGTKTYTIARSTPSFRLDFPEGIDVQGWTATEGAEFKAELTLEYPDAAILAQFTLVTKEAQNIGVNLGTSSYLAYTENALPTTTIHQDAEWDTSYFYRKDYKAASLNYYPVKRTESSTVENVNQLGVNGWNQQKGTINSAATYDASALDGAGNAQTLRCTLSLKKKTSGGSYLAVDNWTDYLAGGSNPAVSVYYNASDTQATASSPDSKGNVYICEYTLVAFEKDVPVEIRVDMDVLTGSDFETPDKTLTYANYKVEMCVELLDSTGTNVIAGSRAEDYIVYTNAKINPQPIR